MKSNQPQNTINNPFIKLLVAHSHEGLQQECTAAPTPLFSTNIETETSLELTMALDSPYLLLVEDNIIALRIVETIMQQTGYRFRSATNGEEAYELAKSEPFDLILTDLGLPGMSGNDLTKAVREWETINHLLPVPIVGLTAHDLKTAENESLQAGMNKVLSKPIQSNVLKSVINQFIRPQNKETTKLLGTDLPANEEHLFLLEELSLLDINIAITNLGNKTLLREMLSLLLHRELPGEVLKIQKAYNESSWDMIENLAHKLKSSAVYCGTTRLKYACQYLERYRKAGYQHQLDRLYYQLIRVIDDSKLAIEKWLEQEII